MVQTTLDGTSPDPATRILTQARSKLVEDNATSIYLGKEDFFDRVVWKKVDNSMRLVTTASATAVEIAHKKRIAAQSGDLSSTSETKSREDDEEPDLEPATLSIIGVVDDIDCFLAPCGHWKGPKSHPERFQDLKLAFNARAASQESFNMDFSVACENGKKLMDLVAREGANVEGFLGSSMSASVLRFRHKVFESVEPSASDSNSADSSSEAEFKMSDWPVISPEAAAERDKMVATHRPIPLPAYDRKGDLIAPAVCRKALAGAAVRVTFTLSHWFIEGKPKENIPPINRFVADAHSIRVLVEPIRQALSPKKRSTPRRDPGESPPRKKANTSRK